MRFSLHNGSSRFCLLLYTAGSLCTTCNAGVATLKIDPETVIKRADPHRLTGTNVSLWSRRPIIENESFRQAIREWAPAYIRMPGGSWSNEYYWNGNGVRIGEGHAIKNFDLNRKNADGTWEIDFSDYKKGFRLHGEDRDLDHYHGDIDVKLQHEWINKLGSEAVVTVNAGSGQPKLAAEWVKWANKKQGFGVTRWEIGNELNGDWEMGHRLPDGSSISGEVYAQRFLQWAEAMRAEDPDIRLGGPACSDLALDFVEETIRDAGEQLDFVSIHAYPVGVKEKKSANKFAAIDQLYEAVARIDRWIERYQPDRVDEIEIAVTEWNIKVNEDRDTAELISALWSAIWVGAMFETGVDFANQWDLTTYTPEGGHSAFNIDESSMTVKPKSQYWAMWMWSNLMGDELVSSKIEGNERVKSFVTRSEDGLQIMLVNTSQTEEVDLRIGGIHLKEASLHTYSGAEYFWDPHARRPLWSLKPTQTIHRGNRLRLPEFSISILQLPTAPGTLPLMPTIRSTNEPILHLCLPDRVPADRAIEAWIVAHNPAENLPFLKPLRDISLTVEGPARLSTDSIDLSHAAARFEIVPTGAGTITVSAQNGILADRHQIELVALKERPQVYWTFDNPLVDWNAKSTFMLHSESSIRPNQFVAASRLQNQKPARNADILFHFEPLPRDELPFENASGVIGKLRAAKDLDCDDPEARVNVILQSNANHWMPVGSIRLQDMIGKWNPFEFKVSDPDLQDAMSQLYGLRIQIQSRAPIRGDIYLDDLGFIFRTGM